MKICARFLVDFLEREALKFSPKQEFCFLPEVEEEFDAGEKFTGGVFQAAHVRRGLIRLSSFVANSIEKILLLGWEGDAVAHFLQSFRREICHESAVTCKCQLSEIGFAVYFIQVYPDLRMAFGEDAGGVQHSLQ